MCCNRQLGFGLSVWSACCQNFPHLANEGLLDLCMQMNLRLLDKDHLTQGAIVFRCQPLPVKMIDLNGHKHEVLKT